jgi:hypothetical protein
VNITSARDELRRVNYLLTTSTTGKVELPRIEWTLYDISDNEVAPVVLSMGKGLDTFEEFITLRFADFAPSVRSGLAEGGSAFESKPDIAFSPSASPDRFVSAEQADKLAVKPGVINRELRVGQNFTLRKVWAKRSGASGQLLLLVRVNEIPEANSFRLAITLEGKTQPFALWSYAMAGDYLLVSSPWFPWANAHENGITLGFVNSGQYPKVPLKVGNKDTFRIRPTETEF